MRFESGWKTDQIAFIILCEFVFHFRRRVTGEKEIDIPLLFDSHHFDKIKLMYELDFEDSKRLPPFDAVLDIYGDNSIFAISTKGHTKGHVSYLLNAKTGPVLIAGDEVNIPENIQYRIGPGSYSSDVEQADNSFQNILFFIERYPETTLVYGHSLKKGKSYENLDTQEE